MTRRVICQRRARLFFKLPLPFQKITEQMSSHRPTSYALGPLTISPPLVLAPMEGVTNLVFRRLVRGFGGLGLTYTEFFPSKDLARSQGRLSQLDDVDPDEAPLAIQLFGRDPDLMARAAVILEERGAQIIDINMGCPSKRVCSNSGGSALMREPDLAVEIVKKVRAAIKVPLSVKMRSGFDAAHRNAPELARRFEDEGVNALAIHWRTREDGYDGIRDVEMIARAVEAVSIPVLGNGDIVDIASAQAMLDETGCAGLMIGRGAIENPWLPRQLEQWLKGQPVTPVSATERAQAILRYAQDLSQTFGSDHAALGRVKMMIRHVSQSLPCGEQLKRSSCRERDLDAALTHMRRYFDWLQAYEQGLTQAPYDLERLA